MRFHFHLRNCCWIPKNNILSFSTFATPKSDVSPRFSQIFIFHFSDISHHFPIIFPSCAHHVPIIFPFSHHFPMISPSFPPCFSIRPSLPSAQRQHDTTEPRPCVLYQLGASWGPEWTSESWSIYRGWMMIYPSKMVIFHSYVK